MSEHQHVKQSLASIDVAKFIGSVLIFAMHCNVLENNANASLALEILSRWGVPFFFISSSYFLFSKGTEGNITKEHLRRYVFRVGMLYVLWGIFNLPSIYVMRLYQNDVARAGTWLEFIKNSILSSTFTGSWYLLSSIFSAWLVFSLSKRFKTKTLLIITSIPYVLCALSSVYYGVLPSQVSSILSFLCFPLNVFNGCFYFSIGKMISEKESELTRFFTHTRSVLLSLVFYLVYALELAMAKHFNVFGSTDVAFSTVALSSALFFFCIQVKKDMKCSLLLRKLSTIIYCCQGNVLIFNSLCKLLLGGHSILAFILSCLVVAAICIIALSLQKRTHWKWAKYLT